MGAFGYFPTYMLGTMLGAQFFGAMKEDIPSVSESIKSGDFQVVTNWLKSNIHSKGSLMPASELVKKVTKRDLDVELYKSYLKDKFL